MQLNTEVRSQPVLILLMLGMHAALAIEDVAGARFRAASSARATFHCRL